MALRFGDRALEDAFLEEWARIDRRRYVALWLLMALLMLFSSIANWALPTELAIIDHARYVFGVPAAVVALLFALASRSIFERGWQWVQMASLFAIQTQVIATGWLIIHQNGRLSPEANAYGVSALSLEIMVCFTLFSLRFATAAIAAAPPAIAFVVSFAALAPNPLYVVMWIGGALLTGGFAGYQIEHLRRAEFQRRRELAAEREKTVRSLKTEVSHQVAERSRELGEMLAKKEPVAVRALMPGERFHSRYKVVRALGSGGMGTVYEVERTTDTRRLALKIANGAVSQEGAARFAREAEIGARVQHDNVVSIVDVGMSSGAPFLVMDLVVGDSLDEHRERFGDVAWGARVLAQIARGLCALHEAGVVHRDLKPANVLLEERGAELVVKISDFGISRLGPADAVAVDAPTVDAAAGAKHLTGTGAFLGTPQYMAPEAARGGKDLGMPADVFAFGILAYEMLTGRAPFRMPPVLLAMAQQPIPSPEPFAPDAIASLILACLAPDAAKRPTSRRVRDQLSAHIAS